MLSLGMDTVFIILPNFKVFTDYGSRSTCSTLKLSHGHSQPQGFNIVFKFESKHFGHLHHLFHHFLGMLIFRKLANDLMKSGRATRRRVLISLKSSKITAIVINKASSGLMLLEMITNYFLNSTSATLQR